MTIETKFIPNTQILSSVLEISAALHHHLCPRQVLGARMGLFGLRLLGLWNGRDVERFKNEGKRLLTIAETDGCGLDGISAATNCWVGRRTLRVEDYGKMGATLIDTLTGQAVRVSPRSEARDYCDQYAPFAESRWHAYLEAYHVMPDHLLLKAQAVELTVDVAQLISQPGMRESCAKCGEEIMNEREIWLDHKPYCIPCANGGYYQLPTTRHPPPTI